VPRHIEGAARGRVERRFAVYRNNVVAGLIDTLSARFPVVQRLVGDEFFRAMARAYALSEPPRSPLLIHYGESFADFIDRFEAAAPLPYLSDIARVEFARVRAYHAADANPLTYKDFGDLPVARFSEFRVGLHPSVGIIVSDFPIVSIWEANQAATIEDLTLGGGERALIARPRLDVETRRIGAGDAIFLTELKAKATIAEAADAASAAADFDLATSLSLFISAELAVGILP
jgi:hypothetical protein